MASNFYFNNGGTTTDFSDVFIRRDLFSSGGLWTWGYNINGQLGDNTTVNKSSPIQTVAGGTNWKQVSSGVQSTAAIKTDGTLWTWGYNTNGTLGDNTFVNKSSPVQTVAGGTNWKQVACGFYNTAAIKTDGTLWTWGYNINGQLGDNTIANKSSPVQTVAGGTNWKQVTCYYHTAAIKTDGTLWTWGYNNYGQLGDNTGGAGTYKSSPVQTVAGGTNWKQVACGFYNTAAIKTDGTLWTWGYNINGQLGDNTIVDKSSPVQTVAGGTNWNQVACGDSNNTAAIKTDGTLWLWGANDRGTLGDNTIVDKSSPVQTVAGGTNWKQVACGFYNTAAIKTDGTLWTWGDNSYGQLGDNTIVNKSSPIQTVAGGTNWKQVYAGYYNTAAITDIY
jgi:alpha-tubulin suppressor-like RCC1 family protein